MEFVEGGTLEGFVRDPQTDLNWRVILRVAWQVAEVVGYLHSRFPCPIVHGDLAGKNILVSPPTHPTLP